MGFLQVSLEMFSSIGSIFLAFFSFFFFGFLGPYLWHMEVPRLGVELELQVLAYTTATAMGDPSHICDLHTARGNTGSPTH